MPLQFSLDPQPLITPGERHLPCVLLVDTSSSMSGIPISELNKGLVEFGDALQSDSLARGCVEVCVISFNSSVQTEMSFRPVADYEAPTLSTSGLTSMNEAIEAGLDALEARQAEYLANGVNYYRPWLFLLTDGAPTDTTKEASAKARLHNAITNKKVFFLPICLGPTADGSLLQSYYPDDETIRPVLQAKAGQFKELFNWLGNVPFFAIRPVPKTINVIQFPPLPSSINIEI